MTIHYIEPTDETLHGPFSRDRKPILTIDSGDTVRFKTLDAGWGLEPFPEEGKRRQHEARVIGHALCGPVAIRGAKPGMVLEIQINNIVPGAWGWTSGGGFGHALNKWLGLADGKELTLRWTIDTTRMMATNQLGHQVPLHPFMGVMGMPADVEGDQPTAPPRFTGGNIDCKELIAGSTLYLPIAVEGGLFSTGDGHGVQGDGEVSVTAIECPMDLADLTFRVRDDLHFAMPRANTPEGWITFGFHEDLNEASMIALSGMLDLMGDLYGYSRKEALALASVVVDLKITQIVNGTKGCHAILRREAASGLRPHTAE